VWEFGVPPWELALRSAIIYLAMVAALRLFGKREVGQFTLFDLVLILLVANAVQPAMTGTDSSVGGGLVIIVTLVLINRGVASARSHIPAVDRLLEAEPTVLARNGAWIEAALHREELDRGDVEMALREHGVADVSEVELAVLESDGTISVVPRDRGRAGYGDGMPRRRRVRLLRRR
jgi:uncharacterized membrane protein YcaP (DUF421 family)